MNMASLLAIEGSALTPDQVLGVQVISTIPDRACSFDRLRTLWQIEGLDGDLLPDESTLVNTAENACASVKTRKGRVSGHDDRKLVVDVDRISTAKDGCEYQVTRKVLDTANRVIDHKKGMTLSFDAQAHREGRDPWTVRPFVEEDYLAVRGLEVAIREHFNEHVGTVPGQRVRNALREYLVRRDKLGATSMKDGNGGVYFVRVEYAPTVDSLERVVEQLYGDDAQFDVYVIPNSEAARKQVAKQHAFNVADEAAELSARISERMRESGKKPRREFIDKCAADLATLVEHKRTMDALLGDQARRASTAFDLLEVQLNHLLSL